MMGQHVFTDDFGYCPEKKKNWGWSRIEETWEEVITKWFSFICDQTGLISGPGSNMECS